MSTSTSLLVAHKGRDPPPPPTGSVQSHTATELKSNTLLMTCKLLIEAPDGKMVEVRGILDSASSASFVSECMAQSLGIPRHRCKATISGIAGLSHPSNSQFIANFNIAPVQFPDSKMNPRVACDLPTSFIPFNPEWKHLLSLKLADPSFESPGRIDVLLGVHIFTSVLQQGQRSGPVGSPTAFKT